MLRLVVSNQRGGVSKTTTTATLARIFADQGMRVLVVDADPQGSLGLILGLRPSRHFYDFVVRNYPLGDCVVTAAPNLDVLCGSRDTAKVEITLSSIAGREFVLSRLLGDAEAPYDGVLIDVSPSINLVQTCAMLYAGRVLIPVGMDMLSLQGAVACCETARLLTEGFAMDVRPVALLPSMVDRRFSLTAYVLKALEEMSERYGIALLQPIRTDGMVPRAGRAKKFLVDYNGACRAMEDYRAAAAQLAELPEVKSATARPHAEALTA